MTARVETGIDEKGAVAITRKALREMARFGVRLRARTCTVGTDRVVFVTISGRIPQNEYVSLQQWARENGFCIR
jgi:hypothetical protein